MSDKLLISAVLRFGWPREKKILYYFKGTHSQLVTLIQQEPEGLRKSINDLIEQQKEVELKFGADKEAIETKFKESTTIALLEAQILKKAKFYAKTAPFGIKYQPSSKTVQSQKYNRFELSRPLVVLAQIYYLKSKPSSAYGSLNKSLNRQYDQLRNILYNDDAIDNDDYDVVVDDDDNDDDADADNDDDGNAEKEKEKDKQKDASENSSEKKGADEMIVVNDDKAPKMGIDSGSSHHINDSENNDDYIVKYDLGNNILKEVQACKREIEKSIGNVAHEFVYRAHSLLSYIIQDL